MLVINKLLSDSFRLVSADIRFCYKIALPNNDGLYDTI